MNGYQKIVNDLVEKSFPNLRSKWIIVSCFKFQIKGYYAMVISFGFIAWIWVFPLIEKSSKKGLQAVLAHELGHLEVVKNMGFLKKLKFGFKILFTRRWKAWFENAADKCAIEKGYALGLYENVYRTEKERSKSYLKFRSSKGYLSSKEIKAYAKNIGKW